MTEEETSGVIHPAWRPNSGRLVAAVNLIGLRAPGAHLHMPMELRDTSQSIEVTWPPATTRQTVAGRAAATSDSNSRAQ